MPKKIIICFDGTSNDPKDAKQKKNLNMELNDGSVSNIFKLHLLLGGGIAKGEQHILGQQSFYYSGVGTYGNKLLQWFNAGLALPNMDVAKIIKTAASDLAKTYQINDEVFIFGFSRGAAIARRFAAAVNENVKKYRPDAPPIRIRFIGVFDTVASIGFPNLDDDNKPVSDVKFENCTVANTVDEALHMVSIDEKRTAFMPTLMAHDTKRVTEIWFAGAHSDIGGGYRYDGLSDITLNFLIDELTHRSLGLGIRAPLEINFQTDDCKKLGLAYDDIAIHPNPLGKSHQQDRGALLDWTLTHRDLRVHIETVDPNNPNPMPQVHYTVVERIHGDSDYRPVTLSTRTLDDQTDNQIAHEIWRPDGELPKRVNGLAEHLRIGPPAAKKLEVNDSRVVTVYASNKMNRSYIYANKGEKYSFKIDMAQKWFDSGITCGPKGWNRQSQDFPWYQDIPMRYMEDERRCPKAQWFEIIGMIGKKEQQPFQALKHKSTQAALGITKETGELFFFANDLEDRYDNNLGYIQVKVTRTQ